MHGKNDQTGGVERRPDPFWEKAAIPMIKEFVKSVVPKRLWSRLVGIRVEVEGAIAQSDRGSCLHFFVYDLIDQVLKFVPGRPTRTRKLHLKGFNFPLHYRAGTSDISVIKQVFFRHEYQCVADEEGISLILDCGANIGCTSFYLLHRYPEARVIAVEPDPGNFAMCRRNLEPFGDRVHLINAGVWSSTGPLRVVRGAFGDGREWSIQVRPALTGEEYDLMATTIAELIARSGFRRVDLLKIDIEAAEKELFAVGTEKWLPHIRHIVIELHGDDCERVFFQAIAGYSPSFERSGELTVCRHIGTG
jgi:FkbM family methyltransferase